MRGLEKRRDVYHYDFQKGGHRYRGSTGLRNERKALEYVSALRTKISLGEVGLGMSVDAPTLRQFRTTLEDLVQTEVRSPKTRRFYLDCWNKMMEWPTWADMPISHIDEPVINQFRHWALAKVGKTRIDRYMSTLKRALRHAHRDLRMIQRVPVIKMYSVKNGREHVFTDEEYQEWLAAAPEPLRSFSILAHDRGVCRNEMLALKKESIKLLAAADGRGAWGMIDIRHGLKRDARARMLTLTKDMRDALAARMKESKCRFVFCSPVDPTKRLSEYTIGAQLTEHKRKLKSHVETGLHDLRHTFITKAAERIKNVKTLQLIAGHANITTTMKYVHPAQDDIAIALELCDEVTALTGETVGVCAECGQPIPGCKKSPQFSPQFLPGTTLNFM